MKPSTPSLIGVLAVMTIVIAGGWTLHMTDSPVVVAFEEGSEGGDQQGGGDNGGDDGGQESPAPAAPQESSPSQSQSGARRGNETVRLQTIAMYILTHLYKDLLDTNRDRPALSLDEREQAFICSMSRIRQYDGSVTPLWFPEFLASKIDRPMEMIARFMASDACVR